MKFILSVFLISALTQQSFASDSIHYSVLPLELSSTTTFGSDKLQAKLEAVKEEAVLHLSNGEIVDSSDNMKEFLKLAKKEILGKSEFEILELLVEQE